MRKIGIVIALCMLLGGCITNACYLQMTYHSHKALHFKRKSLHNNIAVAEVHYRKGENPNWGAELNDRDFFLALEGSLRHAHLLAKNPKHARYLLNTTLVSLSQPPFTLDMPVRSIIYYSLMDRKTKHIIFRRKITAIYESTIQDSYYAYERLQMANAGSARTNIQYLLKSLQHLR